MSLPSYPPADPWPAATPSVAPPAGALAVEVAGETLLLLAEKAAWWPRERMLLVADAHLGKAQSFRRLGVAVPRGSTSETLDGLGRLLERLGALRLVFLGDLLHSRHAQFPATLGALARWRSRHAALDVTLVRGNHDDRAGDPPPSLGIEVLDEPLAAGPFALCHHPRPQPRGGYVLAGHLHPCVGVGGGRARDWLRLPCFHFGPSVGVLPAFGAFTGMHPIARGCGDRVWAVTDAAVVALPRS